MALAAFRNLLKVLLADERSEDVNVGRELTRFMSKLGVNNSQCRRLVHGYKLFRNPALMLGRSGLASTAASKNPQSDHLERFGYVAVPAERLEGTAKVMDALRAIWVQRCQGPEFHPDMDWVGGKKKAFLRNCLLRGDFEDHPEIADWLLQPELLRAATRYFGHVPMLGGVRLWWSPVNNTQQSSQMFHLDWEDTRMLRVFLHVTEVTEASGPFTFISAEDSRKVVEKFGGKFGRLTDEQVFSVVDPSRVVKLLGPAGSVYFVDPARCVHYGSRSCDADRLLLMVHYNPVPVHLEPTGWIPPDRQGSVREFGPRPAGIADALRRRRVRPEAYRARRKSCPFGGTDSALIAALLAAVSASR